MFQFGGFDFPQLMMVNLGQITTTDPYFDSAGFLSFAQGAYWKIHQAAAAGDLGPVKGLLSETMQLEIEAAKGQPKWASPIQSLEQAAITNVGHDASWDTVTVRVGSTSAAKKKNELVEDWTFQRQSVNRATATSAPPVTQCPSCGAPVSVDEHGNCRYCGVPIKGVVGDWRLVSTNTPTIPKASSGGRGCGPSGFVMFIILVTVIVPLVITAVVLYEVNKTTDQAFNSFGGPNFPFSSSTTTRANGNPLGNGTTGSLDGTLSLTGGLSANLTPDTLTTPDGDTGTCSARAPKANGVNFTANVENDDAGVQQQVIVTVALPNGSKGPGTYDGANVSVVLHETALPGATNADAEDNTWASSATSTASVNLAANDSGSVTFAGLAPTDPKWKALGGTLTFTCT